jgi:hypothetical protein
MIGFRGVVCLRDGHPRFLAGESWEGRGGRGRGAAEKLESKDSGKSPAPTA